MDDLPIIKTKPIYWCIVVISWVTFVLLMLSALIEAKIQFITGIEPIVMRGVLFSILLLAIITSRLITWYKQVGRIQITEDLIRIEVDDVADSISLSSADFRISNYSGQQRYDISAGTYLRLWEDGTDNYLKCTLKGKDKEFRFLIKDKHIFENLRLKTSISSSVKHT